MNPSQPSDPAESGEPVEPTESAQPAQPAQPAGPTEPTEPVDPRYLLANERTLLAWLRTGLSLQAAGLAVAEFVHGPPRWVRGSISGILISIGVLVAALGYRHAREVKQAMYDGTDIPDASLLNGVCMAVVVIGVLLGAAILVTF